MDLTQERLSTHTSGEGEWEVKLFRAKPRRVTSEPFLLAMGDGLLCLWACHANKFEAKEINKGLINGSVNAHVNLPVTYSSSDPLSLLPRFCIPSL